MATLTGGQALVQQLKKEGVSVIFGLPGVQLDWAFDALYEERDHIRVIHTRHEQATSYMADGYARSSGGIGTCLVVPGPGLLNAGAGLATAYACSSPVLCIAGQIPTEAIGLGRGMLHEIKGQREAIGCVTKWTGRAAGPTEVPGVVHEAFHQLQTGRPRPVEIEVPPDVLSAQGEVHLSEPERFPRFPGDPTLLAAAAKALGQSEQPLIFAGGGVISSGAWAELRELAELLEAPVVMTSGGRGAISDDHYLAQLPWAGQALLSTADVALAVGTRLLPRTPLNFHGRTLIQLDIDSEEIGRNHRPDIGIEGDAKLGLAALVDSATRVNRRRPSRKEDLLALKARARNELEGDEHRAPLGLAIRTELPEDGIFVSESTQVGYWSSAGGFPVYQPRTFITAGYQGTLGYGVPTAMGAKVANPDKKVVVIAGDGGFMYNVQELSTMVRHRIPVVAVIFNDNAYGNVQRSQQTRFDGRYIASDLYNPDFVRLAESFGILGMRARGASDLQRCLREALAADAPALIEVPVGPMPSWNFAR